MQQGYRLSWGFGAVVNMRCCGIVTVKGVAIVAERMRRFAVKVVGVAAAVVIVAW